MRNTEMAEAIIASESQTGKRDSSKPSESARTSIQREGAFRRRKGEFSFEKDAAFGLSVTKESNRFWSPFIVKDRFQEELQLSVDKEDEADKLVASAQNADTEGACGVTDSESFNSDWVFCDYDTEVQPSGSDIDLERQPDVGSSLPELNPNDEADVFRQLMLLREPDQDIIDLLMLRGADRDFIDLLMIRGADQELIDLFLSDEKANSPVTTYPLGELKTTECLVCNSVTALNLRPCCAFPVCNTCLETYFQVKVSEAVVKISCPNLDCSQKVHRDEILARLNVEMKLKFNQFLVDANREPHRKTCPRCSCVMTIDLQLLRDPAAKKFGLRLECVECSLVWCFPCQAPWHEGMKCKDYRRGDKLVKAWARERSQGQANAQRCPKCKVFIQRSSGCDHMTCSHCNTHFCYQCGEKFREFKFIGNHYSRLSIFGCKYLYKHDKPAQRKLVRGSIFGAKLLAAPFLGGLALGAGAVVAGIGLVVLPFYGGYKLHKKLQRMKDMKMKQQLAMRNATLLCYRTYSGGIEGQLNSNFPEVIFSGRFPTTDDVSNQGTQAAPSVEHLNRAELGRTDRNISQPNGPGSLSTSLENSFSALDAAKPSSSIRMSSYPKLYDLESEHRRYMAVSAAELEVDCDMSEMLKTYACDSTLTVDLERVETALNQAHVDLDGSILAVSKSGEIFV